MKFAKLIGKHLIHKQPVYYVQKSYRNEDGKPPTKYVERLGTLEDLEKRFWGEDPVGEAKKYVAELTAQEKEIKKKIMLEYNPAALIDKNTRQKMRSIIAQTKKREKDDDGSVKH